MSAVARLMILDIEEYLNKNTEAPAKRIRANTKILKTLGKSFRIQSILKREQLAA